MVTKSEHEKERRAFWDGSVLAMRANSGIEARADVIAKAADGLLAERDKRFPAPESGEK